MIGEQVPLIKNIDVYYLGYKRAKANFDDATGKEIRHSLGTRIWGKDIAETMEFTLRTPL